MVCGGGLSGRRLEELGGVMRYAITALELTAAALAGGQSVPAEVLALMRRPNQPAFPYWFFGRLMWRAQAKLYGTQRQLLARPWEEGT